MRYRILIELDENGIFVAEYPPVPGCISQGKTRKETLDNIHDAIKGFLISLKKHNEPIPPSIEEEIVEISLLVYFQFYPGKNICKILRKIGYCIDHQTDSHIILRNENPPYRRLTVTDHREIAKGTLKAILRQAGLSLDEFNNLRNK